VLIRRMRQAGPGPRALRRPLGAAPDCTTTVKFAEHCKLHADRLRWGGSVDLQLKPTPEQRFWSKVQKSDGCWSWMGWRNDAGYGGFTVDGKFIGAHRYSLILAGVTIPDGYDVDHLCRVPHCVNPTHLEPVTHQENMRRAPHTAVDVMRNKTHCPRGHEYTPENTYVHLGKKTSRRCRQCKNADARRRRKEAPRISPEPPEQAQASSSHIS